MPYNNSTKKKKKKEEEEETRVIANKTARCHNQLE